jgi:uncharacterized ion transporter superfamily protein YfcC
VRLSANNNFWEAYWIIIIIIIIIIIYDCKWVVKAGGSANTNNKHKQIHITTTNDTSHKTTQLLGQFTETEHKTTQNKLDHYTE